MHRFPFFLILALAACSGASVGKTPPQPICHDGATQTCRCQESEETGTAFCSPDGFRWSACVCEHSPAPDAGPYFCYDGGCISFLSCDYGNGPFWYGSDGMACHRPDGGTQ